MASTLLANNLVVTITEEFTSNGQKLTYTNQQKVSGVKPFDPRVMTIPTTEVQIINFGSQVGAGAFITANIRYIRIANKDDTNFIRVRLKKIINNQISTLGAITPGTIYPVGTYSNINLTGGTGTGATANIVVAGSIIYKFGTITPGLTYTAGTYTNVPLTGGSGTGATATVVIAGGIITSVTITNRGTGYVVGDVLSCAAASVGGTGTGFSIPVASLAGGVSVVTLVLSGINYTNGDNLSALNTDLGGNGSGFIIPVSLVASVVVITDKRVGPASFFIIGDTSFNINSSNSAFVSFVTMDSISAQADTSSVDIEYFVASV